MGVKIYLKQSGSRTTHLARCDDLYCEFIDKSLDKLANNDVHIIASFEPEVYYQLSNCALNVSSEYLAQASSNHQEARLSLAVRIHGF